MLVFPIYCPFMHRLLCDSTWQNWVQWVLYILPLSISLWFNAFLFLMSKEWHSIKVIKVSEMYCASFGQMRGGKEDGEGKEEEGICVWVIVFFQLVFKIKEAIDIVSAFLDFLIYWEKWYVYIINFKMMVSRGFLRGNGWWTDLLLQFEHVQSEHVRLALENWSESPSDLRIVFCFKYRSHRKAWWAYDNGMLESTEFVLFSLFLFLKGKAGSTLHCQRPLECVIARPPVSGFFFF